MSISIAGNNSTTANLSIGASSTGRLDFFGDTDWWRVSLTAGYGYRFWVEGVSASAGTLPNEKAGGDGGVWSG